MIYFFCCISGDRKEEASAEYFAHAAAAHRVSKDSVPPSRQADLWADPHGDKGVTPDMLQTRGQARQCLASLGSSGSAAKAKQAGVQLFYTARASLRALLWLNKYKTSGD